MSVTLTYGHSFCVYPKYFMWLHFHEVAPTTVVQTNNPLAPDFAKFPFHKLLDVKHLRKSQDLAPVSMTVLLYVLIA